MKQIGFAALLAAALVWGVPSNGQTPMMNPEAARAEAAERLAASIERLSFRPDLAGVMTTLLMLEQGNAIDAAKRAEVAALKDQLDKANREGRVSEALRSAYRAIALLQGRDWATDAFPASLAFDVQPVADPGQPLLVRVRANWNETVPADTTLALRLAEYDGGKPVRDLGRIAIAARDLVAQPQRRTLDLAGVDPGTYRLEGEVRAGGRLLGTIRAPISLVPGFFREQSEIEAALARIDGHADAKATIIYPFNLAAELYSGTREVRSYDFAAGVARSRALLASLEAGKDPIVRAKGDIRRAYYFEEAGTIVPFRLYVPTTWEGRVKLPLVVFLHGANLDDDDSMERANGLLPRLAEERGVILLAPLGYRMNSMYGAPVPKFAASGSPISELDPRRVALSEQDVINLTDLISKEYDVDRSRIYLSGNSMGAMGTWHLAQKYPKRWTAIAPAAAGATDDDYDFSRLRGMPIMAVAGEHDFLRPMVEETVAKAKAAGLEPHYMMVAGGDHGTGVEIALPAIFDFFLKHRRAIP